MSNLTPAQAKELHRVLSQEGVDTHGLKASNPFTPEFSQTPRGREIQMMISAMSPQMAIELKREAGHIDAQPSLAMAAAMADKVDPSQFTGKLQAEYQKANPQLVQDQQQKAIQEQKSWFKTEAERMARNRLGNKAYNDAIQAETAKAAEAEKRLAEGKRVDERIRKMQDKVTQNLRVAAANAQNLY